MVFNRKLINRKQLLTSQTTTGFGHAKYRFDAPLGVVWCGIMGFSRLFLFALKLAIYSNSLFLCLVVASLYGLFLGGLVLHQNMANGMKSLARYGVDVIQKRLSS